MNTQAIITICVFLVWGGLSWNWFTCDIKGFCPENAVTSSDAAVVAPSEEANDELVHLSSTDSKVTESSTELTSNELPTEEISDPIETSEAFEYLDISFTKSYASGQTNLAWSESELSDARKWCEALKNADGYLTIVGHTDAVGPDDANHELGLVRANDALASLVSCGCSEENLKVKSQGETEPIADNSSLTGKAENRRIHISFTKNELR